MTAHGYVQIALFFAVIVGVAVPLGVHGEGLRNQPIFLKCVFGPLERIMYRLAGVRRTRRRTGNLRCPISSSNVAGILLARAPAPARRPAAVQGFPAPSPDLSWNTAGHLELRDEHELAEDGGESTPQLLLGDHPRSRCRTSSARRTLWRSSSRSSAASRARRRGPHRQLWVDLVRSTLYILLPIPLSSRSSSSSKGSCRRSTRTRPCNCCKRRRTPTARRSPIK